MKLALLGAGSVAQALLPLLELDGRFGVAGIHTRSRPAAPSAQRFLDEVNADTLVEVTTLNPITGEPAISHIEAAFARGMHVVTANKGPIAHAYNKLQTEAETRKLEFRFESAVMDGAPVFNLFRQCMPRVQVLGITGVLNSTSNLVIEAMAEGKSFEAGLENARERGVAEADASYDIDGWDSATKTAALANVLMGADIRPQAVAREGIRPWTPDRVQALAKDGRRVRLVSRAMRAGNTLALTVRPEILRHNDPLAVGSGTSNIILFHTDLMGTFGTVAIAPGVEQTAFGVYSDLVAILTRC